MHYFTSSLPFSHPDSQGPCYFNKVNKFSLAGSRVLYMFSLYPNLRLVEKFLGALPYQISWKFFTTAFFHSVFSFGSLCPPRKAKYKIESWFQCNFFLSSFLSFSLFLFVQFLPEHFLFFQVN